MSIAGAIGSIVRPRRVRTKYVTLPQPAEMPGAEQRPRVAAPSLVGATHNDAIDAVRLFAAAGIVFVHVIQTPIMDRLGNFFRFAVPFFLFASLYFQSLSLRKNTDRTFLQYVISRTKRLYLPFLAWSAIYIIARDLKRATLLHLPPVAISPGVLIKGPEYHLWFLPFLLATSIALAAIHYALLRRHARYRWPLIGLAIVGGLIFALAPMPARWDELFDNPTYAYVQWWRAMPAALWAMAFAWYMTLSAVPTLVVPTIVGFAGLVLAVVCSAEQVVRGAIDLIPRALTGLGSILIALIPWHGPTVTVLARLGRYGYGIYLCHVLFVEICHVMASKLHLPASVGLDLAMFAFSFAGSCLLVLALGRSRKTAWLNG